MTVRATLFLGMFSLVTSALFAAGALSWVVIGDGARRSAAEDLGRSRHTVEALVEFRRTLFRTQIQAIADEPRLKAVAGSSEVSAETIFGVAADIRRSLNSELLLITDSSGKLLTDAENPEPGTLTPERAVADALASDEGTEIWQREDGIFQVQARRLAFGATTVGTLVLGYRIDDHFAQTVSDQTASQIVVALEGKVIAQAGFREGARPPGAALWSALANPGTTREVDIAGERYLVATAPFPGAAQNGLRYGVLRSLDAATESSRRLLRLLVGVLGAGMLGAMVIAATVSGRLSRPLSGLVDFTRRLAAGELSSRAKAEGPIEVRLLADSMNTMVVELERARLTMAKTERLHREIEIAAQIQTSLLPIAPAVDGLEIAARMEPATEVGGDYFDVLPNPTGAWIAIGDVAGHGLAAGLLMVMVQNALAALVLAAETKTPRDLVILLNQILYENIRNRLKGREFVTFCLLKYSRSGQVVFAGAHEQILVLRAATGKCEEIETTGAWLGASRDVTKATHNGVLQLHDGDTVLLFTDGITEAMNAEKEQFGLARLMQAFEEAKDQSAEGMCRHVLGSAHAFKVRQDDDMTLVVFRHRASEETPAQPVNG